MKKNEIAKKGMREISTLNITTEDIKKYFCPMATDKELFLALGVIQSLNLNPHTREVHLVKYKNTDKLSIIVGYEVYLKRAERSGLLDGWECGITEDKAKAWVKIHRKDQSVPFYWEVEISDFDKKQATWKSMFSFMAKKVAIAQGFRLCFLDELGGMPYTQEEHQVFNMTEVNSSSKADVPMPKAKSETQEKPATVPTDFKDMLLSFKKAKATIGTELYYDILISHGVEHANSIKTIANGAIILEEMRKIAKEQKEKPESEPIPKFGE